MTIPNLITVARLLCVPALVYAMILGELQLAFGLFLAAGISDAVDGFIARHFNQRSELGTYLDPIADKLLLVSVFVMLTWLAVLPLWFLILVASRHPDRRGRASVVADGAAGHREADPRLKSDDGVPDRPGSGRTRRTGL
jgi:hypothetical protein